MPKRRFAMRLSASEDETLRQQYVHFRIPTDQYKKRPPDLQLFTDAWNYATGRSDSGEELLHYMITQRKQAEKNWPKFEGKHRRIESISGLLSDDEEQALRRIYAELILPLDVGTDEVAYDDELKARLAAAFTRAIGRVVPGALLISYAEAKRKRGLWLTLRRDRQDHQGFDDIAEVG